MFSNKLKRPALALAVTAGLLAVAGPASAATTHEPSPRAAMGTIEELMEFMDYTDDAAVDKDLNQPDMGIREQPTQVNAPHGLSIGSSEVFELNTIRSNGDGNDLDVAGPTGLKFDSNEWAEDIGFTAPSEMDANANASMPDVDDEVLAGVNYEPDVFW